MAISFFFENQDNHSLKYEQIIKYLYLPLLYDIMHNMVISYFTKKPLDYQFRWHSNWFYGALTLKSPKKALKIDERILHNVLNGKSLMWWIWHEKWCFFYSIWLLQAAFMITREEFPNLSGLDDSRLTNPMSHKPPFRFGTIPNGATDYVLKNNFPNTHEYMKK